MGFILAGYSAGASTAEVWTVSMEGTSVDGPRMVLGRDNPDGLWWEGQGAAIARLVRGVEPGLSGRLQELGISPEEVTVGLGAMTSLWHAAMPIQEAIDLVRYLAEVVVGYVRFAPGALAVAAPIDLAAITVHDGFQWVARKQWFNPATGAERRSLAMESGA